MSYIYIFPSAFFNGVPAIPDACIEEVRKNFSNLLILAGDFTPATAALQSGITDLIAFGKPFISNSDLVDRISNNYPLADGNVAYFFEGGDNGYNDYPNYKL